MKSTDVKQLRLLDALFKAKQLSVKEMLELEQANNYSFQDRSLIHKQKVNGFELYELSKRGYEVYKYLKQKKLKEFIIRIIIVIIGAAVIYYLDTKK